MKTFYGSEMMQLTLLRRMLNMNAQQWHDSRNALFHQNQLLVTRAATAVLRAAAGVGLHVDTTAYIF